MIWKALPGSIHSVVVDALRFWERGRLLCNAVALVVLGAYFLAGLPESRHTIDSNWLLFIIVLTVAANLLYSLVYVAEAIVLVWLSGRHAASTRWRWALLLIATATAAIAARSFALGMFSRGPLH